MASLSGDQKNDAQLIGQIGMGFYSIPIAADSITVESRRAGLPAKPVVRWSSGGNGDFRVAQIECAERDSSITLRLKDDAQEHLNAYKLKSVINSYSDHILLPILMEKEEWKNSELISSTDPGGGRQQGGMASLLKDALIGGGLVPLQALWASTKKRGIV